MKNNKLSSFILYILGVFIIFPLIILCIWAFSKNWPWPLIFPRQLGLRGIKNVLNLGNNSLVVLLNSIGISLIVTFLAILISIPAGKALAFYNFKGKNLIKIIILTPLIIPPICIGLGIHVFFIKIGIAGKLIGVVIIHLVLCIPYSVRIITNVFEIIGEKIELQGKILGANKFQRFIYITLPMISSGLISAGSFVFIISFSQYFLTFLIGGGRIITYPILMFPFIRSGDRTIAASYSLVFVLVSLFVLFIIEKLVTKIYKTDKYLYM